MAKEVDEKERRNIERRGFDRQISLSYDFSNALLNPELIQKLMVQKMDARVVGTAYLCMSLVETAHALHHLLDHGFITTAYMVSRALVEGTVNYCFLLQCEEQYFEQWISYSRQKSFRLLDQRARAGDLEYRRTYTGIPDPKQIPGLEDDIRMFTGAKGGEKTRWTELTIEQRLALLKSYQSDNEMIVKFLLIALAIAFDRGSEALHGTLVGAGFARGLYLVPGSGPDSQHRELVLAATLCLSCMLQIGGVRAKLPEIAAASRSSLGVTLGLVVGNTESDQQGSEQSPL